MAGAKMLIVEDDPIVASDIKYKLIDSGYEVCATAVSGEEAIAAAEKYRPAAVLMDIILEGKMDGIQAADEIRKSLAIPVVFLTAHSDRATVQRAKLTLPYGYVLKPIREVELNIALEMALYSGRRTIQKSTEPAPKPSITSAKHTEAELSEIVDVLSKVPALSKVRPTLLRDIAEHCYIREYVPLEILSMEGIDGKGADGFLVLRGRIVMLKTSVNGRELAVQLVGPQSTFGLLSSLDSETGELTSRAQIGSQVLHIPKSCLLYLLSEMPDLYSEFLAELSRRLNALHDMARSLAHDRVDVRVAATLAMLVENERSADNRSKPVEVEISRQELANLCGTTVETAIRVTRGFEKSGILALRDHRLIRVLEPEKLKEIGEGAE